MIPPLISVVGPTAVGKSGIAIRLARRFGGEIISADSRQFYRGMDIGTAKVTPEQRAAVPHHALDIRDPDDTLTLAEFQTLAYRTIDEIHARGHVPFLVGGTGLYVRAVVEGFGIPRVPPDDALRARLAAEAERDGHDALHARLAAVDPAAAAAIDPRNVRRVIRALEVYQLSGRPISELQRRRPPPYRILQIALHRERETLYARADRRIAQMLADGWIDEVRALLDAGIDPAGEAMSALGYREVAAYLRGEIESEAELAAEIGRSTRRFIRHQAGWFRRSDPRLVWFDLGEVSYEEIEREVEAWLEEGDT